MSLIVDTLIVYTRLPSPQWGKRARPDIRERFGFAVKARREELGLTQEDLADRAGIHRTYLSDVERGSRNLSLVNIERASLPLCCLPHVRTVPAGRARGWRLLRRVHFG